MKVLMTTRSNTSFHHSPTSPLGTLHERCHHNKNADILNIISSPQINTTSPAPLRTVEPLRHLKGWLPHSSTTYNSWGMNLFLPLGTAAVEELGPAPEVEELGPAPAVEVAVLVVLAFFVALVAGGAAAAAGAEGALLGSLGDES